MAFLLAVTMGMAADRFDTRRALVVEEANAIGKAYLQADYLPDAEADQMKALLREYLPLRIASDDTEQVQANIQRSLELHAEMWAIAAAVAKSGHSPDLVSSFGESLTDIVSLNQTRIVSGPVRPRSRDRSCSSSWSARSCHSGWWASPPASRANGAS